MKNSLPLKQLPLVVVLAAFTASCDIVNKDVKPREIKATAYTFAGKPAVINLNAFAGGEDLRATGEAKPTFGKIESLLKNKYLLYTPDQSFKGNKEDVSINLTNSEGETAGILNVTITSLDGSSSCSTSGIFDYAEIKMGSTIVVDLLDNDVFCGVGYNGGFLREQHIQNSENVNLSLGPGRVAKLTFTPPVGFTGKVQFIYDLGINWLNPSDVPPSDEELLSNPTKYVERVATALVEINVVEN
jgi:hypothetical protein